ncbi:MAG: strawberry notch-like NTP hydrolase domain-containing protein [Rhodomicrobium sp.]
MTPPAPQPAASACPPVPQNIKAARVLSAAAHLLPSLERGSALDARLLREAMAEAFEASDQDGAWLWKDTYEASEAAAVLFLRKYGPGMLRKSGSPARYLSMIERLSALLPSHTRRSEESDRFQQFSTPLGLGFLLNLSAQVRPGELVLEPSAGTGLLAIHAEIAGAALALNELAETRHAMLTALFSQAPVSRFNAEQIDDYLDANVAPAAVLMNPPFSASPGIERSMRDATVRHIRSALRRLQDGGRLAVLTGAAHDPLNADIHALYADLSTAASFRFTATVDGRIYARHGTSIDTRLTVIDRIPQADNAPLTSAGHADSLAGLLALIEAKLPPRPPSTSPPALPAARSAITPRKVAPRTFSSSLPAPRAPAQDAEELSYGPCEAPEPETRFSDRIYEPYQVQSIQIAAAKPHPTKLVQSAAMASVKPPIPSYRPLLPKSLIEHGILSDAQLETVIYAGEAHTEMLAGRFLVDESLDNLSLAKDGNENAVQFRKGFFLGDGTGSGKGRQAAGIILDNWLRGRRKAVWISKSDKLIEDAQRDWSALGQEKLLIVPQSRYRQGAPIRIAEGILFTTYATLRSSEREGKCSRLQQILDWLGKEFDGVILFDEAHAMANAAGEKSERGDKAPSQQGRAGLRLQHALPGARIVYVSATGATGVQNLAYAQRLGLWGSSDFPFANRADFVAAVEAGGIATMEVLARDLKALGLYIARSLSYEGIEVEIVEHALTSEQIRIYDAYAGAFQIIHQNLEAALKAVNITGDSGTLNGQAKAAAKSAFESNKQRFFNHLITAMKTPTLLKSIEADLDESSAAVVQLVSTGESLMERRLAEIPTSEWGDLSIDVTPREYVLDYLAKGFPTQLYERYADEEGHLQSRPVVLDGQPVQSREAVEIRDRLIEKLASLPPVQTALDQILHHFGTDQVAEVTGRNRRIVKKTEANGGARLMAETRPGSANLAETQSFMDDKKRILVFSDAGGTGRSYHADLSARNQRKRVHYLLEPGWKADTAIQGLGRSNRTNQAKPPLFRPVATNVKGEKRFLSTIAKRLDSLGAITRGQRQTGGQGLFRPEDNLESPYARAALLELYARIYRGQVEFSSLEAFENATGLRIKSSEGTMLEELPPITTFLNRVLALPIALQNRFFELFEELLATRVEAAIASGTYDIGLETLIAESLNVTDRRILQTHERTGAATTLLTIRREDKNEPLGLDAALSLAASSKSPFLVNTSSNRAALAAPASSLTLDDGTVEERVRLIRPLSRDAVPKTRLATSHWQAASEEEFITLWLKELQEIPPTRSSEIHLVTGLLLPVWKHLPRAASKVYRLQTDDGERIVGRLIGTTEVPNLRTAFNLDGGPALSAEDTHRLLLSGSAPVSLRSGLGLRVSTVMGAKRIELTGFRDTEVEQLKSFGFFSEIIAWRLRLFLPLNSETGAETLSRLFLLYPPLTSPANENA